MKRRREEEERRRRSSSRAAAVPDTSSRVLQPPSSHTTSRGSNPPSQPLHPPHPLTSHTLAASAEAKLYHRTIRRGRSKEGTTPVRFLRTSLPSTCVEKSEEKRQEEKMRLPALLCLLWAAAGPAAAADRSCTDLRQFYTSKGFTLGGVPQAEISGEFPINNHLIEHCTWTTYNA